MSWPDNVEKEELEGEPQAEEEFSVEEHVEDLQDKGYSGAVTEFYDGFIDWTGEPISFMSPMQNPILQWGLNGRDRLMAFMPPNPQDIGFEDEFDAPEWPEYPVANQMNPHITPEKLEEMEAESEFPRHTVYVSSSRGFDRDALNYLDDSDFFTLVNPLDARPVLYDKMNFAEWAEEKGQPVLPTEDLGEVYLNGEEWTEDRLGRTDRLILKKNRSAEGKGIWEKSYEELEEICEESDLEEPGTGYSVQPLIPHEVDKRLKLIDGVIAAEDRWGDPDDIRCNLSAATEADGYQDEDIKAMKVYAFDLAEPLAVDENSDNRVLEEEARQIGEELYADLVDDFADPELPSPNMVVAADVIKTEEENLEFLPEEYRENLLYDEEGNGYFLNEAGNSSGSILDRLCLWEGMPQNIPSIHLTNKLRDITGYQTQEPEQHINNIYSRIWNRVANHYDHPHEIDNKCEQYIEEGLLEPVEGYES